MATGSSCASNASRTAGGLKTRDSRVDRGNDPLVGQYDRDQQGMGFIVPFDRRVLMDILVPPGQKAARHPARWWSSS